MGAGIRVEIVAPSGALSGRRPRGRRPTASRGTERGTSACSSPSGATATTPGSRWSATRWRSGRIAQAFAGPGGAGRRAGQWRPQRRSEGDAGHVARSASPTARASTATAWPPPARWSTAARSTCCTGDYLAELTMLILWKARQKDPTPGTPRSFLTQMEQVLGTCLDRGIKIVTNAGGLNPAGLAAAAGGTGRRWPAPQGRVRRRRRPARPPDGPAGRRARPGQPRHRPGPGRGRRRAGDGQRLPRRLGHRRGAGRRRRHRGLPAGHRRLARRRPGGLVARLGAATTATRSPARSPPATSSSAARRPPAATTPSSTRSPTGATPASRSPRSPPTAPASSPSTRAPAALVSVGTVTAQLLYEIGAPAYANPDVVAHFDTIALDPGGPGPGARLRHARQPPPPDTLKVRDQLRRRLPQHDDDGAHRPRHRGEGAPGPRSSCSSMLGGARPVRRRRRPAARGSTSPTPPANAQATAQLRVTVKDRDPRKVGRRFSNATMELALGGYAGFHTTTPPTAESAYGVYWPTLVPGRRRRAHASCCPTAPRVVVPHTRGRRPASGIERAPRPSRRAGPVPAAPDGRPARVPLGRVVRAPARATRAATPTSACGPATDAAYAWLREYLTVDRFRVAAARGDGPRGPPLRAAQPAGAQLRRRRPARRRRRLVDPPRPAGQGARRVPPLAAGRRARGAARRGHPWTRDRHARRGSVRGDELRARPARPRRRPCPDASS